MSWVCVVGAVDITLAFPATKLVPGIVPTRLVPATVPVTKLLPGNDPMDDEEDMACPVKENDFVIKRI